VVGFCRKKLVAYYYLCSAKSRQNIFIVVESWNSKSRCLLSIVRGDGNLL